jgi:glycosyltransferase involved in cell wall biosynthesis
MRYVGGQAIQAQRLLAHLRDVPGFEVEFLPHDPVLPGPLARLQRMKYVRTVVTTAWYVALLLRRLRRVDVVHTFSAAYWSYALAPLPAIVVARLLGKPVVLNYRSGELEDHLTRWPRLGPRTMGWATRIVTPTPYLTEVYARFGLRADVIPNFLEAEGLAFRTRDPLRPVFLANRNLWPLYNYPVIVEAFRRIQADVPDARLIIAGHGPQEAEVRALVERLGLRHVEFRGKQPHAAMLALYQEADVYLNAPDLDCFPGSILEAFASGIPVVSTNAGGIRYIVEHGRTGYLVGTGDAAGLAEHALRLLADPERARTMAARAREELERRYVWNTVGPRWAETYRELASGRPRGRAHPQTER